MFERFRAWLFRICHDEPPDPIDWGDGGGYPVVPKGDAHGKNEKPIIRWNP